MHSTYKMLTPAVQIADPAPGAAAPGRSAAAQAARLAAGRCALRAAARAYLAAPAAAALAAAADAFCAIAAARGGRAPGLSADDRLLLIACRRAAALLGMPRAGERARRNLAALVRP